MLDDALFDNAKDVLREIDEHKATLKHYAEQKRAACFLFLSMVLLAWIVPAWWSWLVSLFFGVFALSMFVLARAEANAAKLAHDCRMIEFARRRTELVFHEAKTRNLEP